MSVKIVEINSDNSDRRLDNFLISKLKDVPKTKIYKIIRKGEVRVNSSRAKPDYKVKKGDLIRIPPNLEISKNTKKSIKPSLINEFKNNVIYEDKNYLIINKKSGISVHSGTKNFIGIIDILREIHGENIDLCHRLDKYTSGCLVFGKNKQSVRHFNDLLKKRDIKKTYITILKGNLNKNIIVDQPVYKNNRNKVKNSISSFKKIKLQIMCYHLIQNIIDYNMTVQEGLDLPRAFALNGLLNVENSLDYKIVKKLKNIGHKIKINKNAIGGGQCIKIDRKNGVLIGGSDARKDGMAIGY